MIEEFSFYLENGTVRKGSPNHENAAALMEKSMSRLEYVKEQKISIETAPFVFEDVYEAIREGCQALMELRGYKPYSHEAHIAFLKEFYQFPQTILSSFDRLRVLRNKAVYGASHVSPQTCIDALGFAVSVIPEFKKHFDKGTKTEKT
ncbi:hypothetical protein HY989_01560 [Candidatus Micrarchaeota archaeon]|nr:hypothetical protein [Candidatus Micrarchaeota archaeon]